ncbi:MAG: penicillin acylase family protein [Bdellovibrionota bacterium]
MRVLVLTAVLFALNAQAQSLLSSESVAPSSASRSGRADIYWTDHGVPHIEARDWYSLGYGSAYAVAQQNFCVLADQLLRTRSERAKYFGPGEGSANIISDVGTLALGYVQDAHILFDKLTPRARELITGYAAGYNRYLSEHTPDQYPRPCRGAEWAQKPTTPQELVAYYLSLAERASGQVLMPATVNAAPPTSAAILEKKNTKEQKKEEVAFVPTLPALNIPHLDSIRLGSNAWSIGKELSQSGGGLLLGNPHFPAYGALRFYQSRMRIPGVYDVQGVSLIGSPCIQIGFNDNLGWTHTVSKSRHFSMYMLEMNPENPLEYKYGNGFRPVVQKDIQIQLLLPNGVVVPYSRPVYFSHYGPMIATPELKWDEKTAFTYRDANRRNVEFIDQWIEMGMSHNLTQFKNSFKKYRGTPWVNTLYSDRQGNAFYIEGTPVPKVTQEALIAWKANPVAQFVYQKLGAFLFRGSNPIDEWQGQGRAIVPYTEAPQLLRKDYVSNHNDSHWVINENEKLTGFSPIYGPEKTELSYRTRNGLEMLKQMSGKDKKFDVSELEASLFDNRSYLWENVGSDIKARCARYSEPDLKSACDSLTLWDGHFNLDSKGFPVFREMASEWNSKLHKIAFNPEDPANTPSGLVAEPINRDDDFRNLFVAAVERLKKSGISLVASLSELQFFRLPDFNGGTAEKIPYHGGQHKDGAFNVQDWDGDSHLTTYKYPSISKEENLNKETFLTSDGYAINGGTSFVLIAEFTAKGPKARGLLTYSQSSDPDSPYFSDQNHMYAEKKLRDFPHYWRDIEWHYPRQTLHF